MGKEGELLKEKKGTFGPDKLPMRDVTFKKGELFFRNRLILDTQRLYQVMIVSADEKELISEMAKAFIGSFKLTPKKK